MAPDQYPQTPPPQTPPPEYPIAPAPPSRTPQGLDAVIDISAHTTVSDFRLVRASNILAVIHKASEGDFYADPMCAERRSQAEAAGLLWGTYHFGKGDSPGAQQAAFFLNSSRPSDDGSVTRQDLAHFLRIKARGQRCRIDQIAEHDSELSTLGRAGVDDGPSVLSIRLGRENASIGSTRSAVS